MTIDEIRQEVARIEACRGDYEQAHSREDDLHRKVLGWIAEHADGLSAQLAAEALRTRDIDFARWCA